MDTETARALIALNNRFYAEHAASFSATRSVPWDGWRRLADLLTERGWSAGELSVLDVACGNLRFEQFLGEQFINASLSFEAVDSCPSLMDIETHEWSCLHFHEVDVLDRALHGNKALTDIPACDLSATFGFMHHIPGFDLRSRVLDELVDHTVSGGLIVISFWQFMQDERLARKALRADVLAQKDELAQKINLRQLDTHDHFLGWQCDPAPLRYCHHFTESEIDKLVASVGTRAREVARYSADGSSGTLNRYVVLERI